MSWFTPEVIDVILTVLKAIVILLAVVVCGALLSFVERRLLGWWQDRYGPNRVGPYGMFQIAADMIKMFFKEDWTPPFADKVIFTLAPVVAMSALLIAFAIIPITPTWGVADLNIGLLFFFAMAGLSVYAVLFAGWSSNNKFALLGSLRASAQTVSYEVFMGLALMGIVIQAGSFNMRDIVEYQAQNLWFIIPQFFGFCTFFIAGVAVTHRHPFDQPEAEQELADGYHIEYAGMKWGMFFVGEYIGIILISAVLGSILFGIATPSEAAAMGSLGSVFLAIIYRAFTFQKLKESVFLTARTSAMVCWLFVGSYIFSSFFGYLGGQSVVEEVV